MSKRIYGGRFFGDRGRTTGPISKVKGVMMFLMDESVAGEGGRD